MYFENTYLDVFQVAVHIILDRRTRKNAGLREVVVGLLDHLNIDELAQNGHEQTPVSAVRHAATVVALAEQIVECGERQVLVLVQEHLQLPQADAQVGLVELVGDVPAEGAELAALLDEGVEEAEAEEEFAPRHGLVAVVEEVEVRDGVVHVGADEVGAQALV